MFESWSCLILFDKNKIESFFNDTTSSPKKEVVTKHTRIIRRTKLLLPCIAAALIGLLIAFPSLQSSYDFSIDITSPKKGELEKLHIENTIFYITDKDNKINNFTAKNIDETEPGSKLVKLINPEGTLPGSDESWINIKSPVGFFNQTDNILDLTDNVEMFYSDGMNAETEALTFDFNNAKGYGTKPVTAEGTFGNLQSEGFEFYSKKNILIFTGKTNINIREESLKGNN